MFETRLATGSSAAAVSLSPSVRCTSWHAVALGDSCPSIYLGARISMEQFLSINPGIQVLCSALFLGCQVLVGGKGR